jgi:hypothetical protein
MNRRGVYSLKHSIDFGNQALIDSPARPPTFGQPWSDSRINNQNDSNRISSSI